MEMETLIIHPIVKPSQTAKIEQFYTREAPLLIILYSKAHNFFKTDKKRICKVFVYPFFEFPEYLFWGDYKWFRAF
jgi:hypothetical protein